MKNENSFNWLLLLKGLLLLIVGFYFVYNPLTALRDISFGLGAVMLIIGFIWAVRTRRLSKLVSVPPAALLAPIATIVAGLLLIFWAEEILTFVFILLGAWILIMGIFQLSMAPAFNRSRLKLSRYLLFLGIFSVLIGIVIVTNPKGLINVLITTLGVVLMLSAGILIVLSFNTSDR